MRYVYCKQCGEPISARSTFHESVVKGVHHRKKLKTHCDESGGLCRDCHVINKKRTGNIECNTIHCTKQINGICDYCLRK